MSKSSIKVFPETMVDYKIWKISRYTLAWLCGSSIFKRRV